MKILCTILFAFLLSFQTFAQTDTPEIVIQKQLAAYNAGDINAFMNLFTEEAELYNHADGSLLAKGKAEVHAIYANLFSQSPKLKSMLKNRMVLGNTVIDHESITGRMGNKEVIELIVIYELKELKIDKVTVIRK